MTNKELMERAAITTAQLAAAGKLNPEQAQRFIDYVIDESVLKTVCRMIAFRPDELVIDKIGVGNRVAVPKAEAVDPQVRRLVSTSKVSLKPVDIMVPFEISDRFVRFNVEEDAVEDHIIRMMATQLANDLDELWIGGLVPGPARLEGDIYEGGSASLYILDSYLSLFDGFLKLAESGHSVDALNAAIGGPVFNSALLAMPTKFRRMRNLLKFMTSPDHEQAYREAQSNRATPLGDTALQSLNNLTPFGVELVPIPLLERSPLYAENSVANTDGTTATTLLHKPITSLVLTPTSIGSNPIAPYTLGVDYSQNLTLGTWTRLAGGTIPSGGTIRATYRTGGKLLLTNPQNLVLGIGTDIRIERDRNIYKSVNEYAITVSVACAIENTDAIVLVKNLEDPTA